jgi:branched-chain amino acid transport system permease protein
MRCTDLGKRSVVWGGYALLLCLAPTVLTGGLSLSLLSQMDIAIIVCLSYNLLLGQGGMVSFGHAVYSGMGAFLAMHSLNLAGAGWPVPVSLLPLLGGAAAALLALPLGWVSTRQSGTPLAMITFGLGELVWALALMFPGLFGGEAGVSANRVVGSPLLGLTWGPPLELYYLIVAYTFVCTGLLYAFTRTPLGRLLMAARDNPLRLAFVGYNPHQVRFLAFVIAAFFAGIAGGLGALHYEMVSTEVLNSSRSGAYLLFTFIGGSTFFFGPILGAVLMVLAFVLLPGLTAAWLLYLGLLFVLLVMWAPGGLAAMVMALVVQGRQGVLRRLWPIYLMLAALGLIAACAFSALVEMTYQLQQSTTMGSTLRFLGLTLDAHQAASWLGMGAMLALAGGMFEVCRRRFDRRLAQAVP